MDLFVVPTIGFDLLYAVIIVRLVLRDILGGMGLKDVWFDHVGNGIVVH